LIVTVAAAGDPRVAPVAAESVKENVFVPEKPVAVLIGTATVLAAASPSAQLRVPVAAV
jgi:hypothetical protein